MSTDAAKRQQQFARMLQDHLRGREEASLLSAYELGRTSLADGLGVLDLATLLQEATLSACHRAGSAAECAEVVKAAGDFAREAFSPFEMAQRAAREANTALRGLNETLEELARRISRELHDEAGQLLVSVYLALADLAAEAPPEIASRLEGMRVLLDRVEGELRRLSHELRPTIVDDLGLVAALTYLADGVSARTGVQVKVETTREARLPAPIEVVLYRIVQEALSNACRHGRAASVKIRLHEQGPTVCCAAGAGAGSAFSGSASGWPLSADASRSRRRRAWARTSRS
jgi:signal transduction histidine kinase